MKKIIIGILLIFISSLSLSFFSGCSPKERYTLKKDSEENSYYSVKLVGFTNSFSGEYIVPEYFGEGENKAPVKEVEEQGFASTSLSKITLPKSITTLNTACFAFNNYLEEVIFEEGTSLLDIPHGTFGNCHSLKNITLPNTVKKIDSLAFGWCNSLEKINLENIEEIGTKAFEGCSSLTQVTFSNTLKKIGDLSFKDSALTSVIIPDSVIDVEKIEVIDGKEVTKTVYGLGYAAFYNCKNLKFAVVGNGIKTIPSGLFGECTALEEVYLPSTIKSIQGAYYSQEKGGFLFGHPFFSTPLKKLNYEGTAAQWQELKLHINNENATQNGITSSNSSLLSPSLSISFSTTYKK